MGVDLFAGSDHPDAPAASERCASLFKRAAAEFHSAFFNASAGFYGSGLQTEQALPLYLGIVPGSVKEALLAYTVNDILVTHGRHTTSGIIGIKCMLEVLSREGRADVALKMLHEETYPSYGYMIRGGKLGAEPATTLWELWDSDQQGPSMNSRNHIMFGTVSSWLHKGLAGVYPLSPGYALVGVRPTGIGAANLTSASASIETPYGEVVSDWTLAPASTTCGTAGEGGTVHLECGGGASDEIVAVEFASYGTPKGSCGGSIQ
jgi:alpha-L-rhamnosidase